MSTVHLQINKKSLESSNLNTNVQSVPFKISADCDAKVAKYFDRYVKNNTGHSKATFRGYPLMGKKVQVPKGYVGLVLHESMRPCCKMEDRNLQVLYTFENITLWNWDKIPDKNDALVQAIDWIEIAESLTIFQVKCIEGRVPLPKLHSPIIEE